VAHSLLEVGVVAGAHGLSGLFRVKLFAEDLRGLTEAGRVVLTLPDGSSLEERLSRIQEGPRGQILVGLDSIHDRQGAEALRGSRVALRREHLPPLEDGEFYLADLLGCEVISTSGESLGTVVELGDNGAQPLIYVGEGSERFHVPALPVFVRDFDGIRLVLDLPEGLREAVTERIEEDS
jgi:16S rRNA processing protein RimM